MSESTSNSLPDPESDSPAEPHTTPEPSPDSLSPTLPAGERDPELEGLDPRELIEGGLRSRTNPTAWEPPTPEELHQLLPQYQIDALIGRGGMGAVYRGRQATLERRVAIKLLPAEMASDAEFVARFKREARTLAQLHHPGIILVHDFGQTSEGHLYFVMEFVEGTDLYKIIHGPGLDCAQALEIVGQICDALQYAHGMGVVHRDIKPANVILGLDGRAKLADFGLARPIDDGSGVFTQTNVVMGTPDYMAPEALAGEADHRADLYSLGVMLYEMLTGKPPRGAWAPPSERIQVDVRLDEVVVRALQEDPEQRYQQASEIGTDVEAIRTTPLQGVEKAKAKAKAKKKSLASSKEGTEEKSARNSKMPWLAGVGLAVVLGVGTFLFPRGPQPSREVLSAREEGGRLRVFGSAENGQPNLADTLAHTDFVEVAIGRYGWVGRRAGGETFGEAGLGGDPSRTPVGPFMTSGLQNGNRGVPTFLTVDGEFRNVWHNKSQLVAKAGEQEASFMINPYDYVVTLTDEGEIASSRPWNPAYQTRKPPPSQFFRGATAWASCTDYYLSAQPDGRVRSFRVDGTETTFPDTIRDIVEMDSSEVSVIMRSSSGDVFVTDGEGNARRTEVPSDLGRAVSVRAGHGMAAAQMEDGTWVAWGNSPELIEQVSKIGHAIDLDFYSEGPGNPAYMMWIEPVEEDTADPSLTPTEVQPDPEVLAARELGGRLMVSGNSLKGPVALGRAAEFDDFQTVVVSSTAWAARRKGGETYGFTGIGSHPSILPKECGPFNTSTLQRYRYPLMRLSADGSCQYLRGNVDLRKQLAHSQSVAFLIPFDGMGQYYLTLDKDGTILFPEDWNEKDERRQPPADFFLGAKAYTDTGDYVISARPGLPVRSFNMRNGTITDFPPEIKDIVELDADSNGAYLILLNSSGQVFVTNEEGQPFRKGRIPHDLGPAIAVRAGGYLQAGFMFAAQMTDGTWRAWGSSDELIEQTRRIGHAIDIDFHCGRPGGAAYMMWIEPVEGVPGTDVPAIPWTRVERTREEWAKTGQTLEDGGWVRFGTHEESTPLVTDFLGGNARTRRFAVRAKAVFHDLESSFEISNWNGPGSQVRGLTFSPFSMAVRNGAAGGPSPMRHPDSVEAGVECPIEVLFDESTVYARFNGQTVVIGDMSPATLTLGDTLIRGGAKEVSLSDIEYAVLDSIEDPVRALGWKQESARYSVPWTRVERTAEEWAKTGQELQADGWVLSDHKGIVVFDRSHVGAPASSQFAIRLRVRFHHPEANLPFANINGRGSTRRGVQIWPNKLGFFREAGASQQQPHADKVEVDEEAYVEILYSGDKAYTRFNGKTVVAGDVSPAIAWQKCLINAGLSCSLRDLEYAVLDGIPDPLKALGWKVPPNRQTNDNSAKASVAGWKPVPIPKGKQVSADGWWTHGHSDGYFIDPAHPKLRFQNGGVRFTFKPPTDGSPNLQLRNSDEPGLHCRLVSDGTVKLGFRRKEIFEHNFSSWKSNQPNTVEFTVIGKVTRILMNGEVFESALPELTPAGVFGIGITQNMTGVELRNLEYINLDDFSESEAREKVGWEVKEVEVRSPENSIHSDRPESGRPWTGPLGHNYVAVDGLANVLFSTWETRVKDFEAFEPPPTRGDVR